MEPNQQPEKPVIPEFMKKYYNASEEYVQLQMDELAKGYEAKRQDFMRTKYAQQQAAYTDHNTVFRTNKSYNPELALAEIKNDYQKRALALAREHGYTAPDELDAKQRPTNEKEHAPKVERQATQAPAQKQENQSQTPGQSETELEQFKKNLADLREKQAQKLAGPSQQTGGEKQNDASPRSESEQFKDRLAQIRANGQSITHRPRM